MIRGAYITLNMADFEDVLRDITARIQHLPHVCKQAVGRTINRTLQAVSAEAIRAASDKYTITSKDLRKAMRIRKAYSETTYVCGTLDFYRSAGRPLVNFKPNPGRAPNWRGVPVKQRRPKAGVSSLIKKGGTRKVYAKNGKKPFFATMKSGHKGLFVRQMSGKLEQLFGPSSTQMFGSDEARDRLQAKAKEIFPKRLSHEVDALLAGVSRGRGR